MILSFVTLVVIVKNFAPVGDVEIQGFFFCLVVIFFRNKKNPGGQKKRMIFNNMKERVKESPKNV